MKLVLCACLLLISQLAAADFLVASRTGNLRESPALAARVIEKVAPGDTLILLRDDQVAGYYHAKSLHGGQEGWIYRTLVRRVAGEVPGDLLESMDSSAVVEVRILDVGAGLCAIIKMPGDHFVVYDAGGDFNTNGDRTLAQIREQVPQGSTVDLLVLSHTDADHIVAAAQVVSEYKVKKVLWSGFEKSMISNETPTGAYRRLLDALHQNPDTENINLNDRDSVIAPGSHLLISGAKFSFLCGFGSPLPEWNLSDQAEKLNAVSIVMRLDYGGNSVLFCGDAVGRHKDDPETALIATEKFLVERAASMLPSRIIVAPHHGARNGSSQAFVDLVQPQTVIFPSGHKYHHPDTRTAAQYLHYTSADHIFRTDRGDDEQGTEWDYGRVLHCKDKYGDDDVHIQLRSNKTYRVFYVYPANNCQN